MNRKTRNKKYKITFKKKKDPVFVPYYLEVPVPTKCFI